MQREIGTNRGQTTTKMGVTTAEKAAFEENGYHVIRGVLNAEEVVTYRATLAQMLQTPTEHPLARLLGATTLPPTTDNPRAIWAGFDLPLFHDAFFALAFHPRLALTVDALIGPDINLYETSCVTKLPGFPPNYRDWHQDSEYSDPQSNDRNVTVILCLDDMDAYSGATWVVPGSHRLGPLPHATPTEPITSGAKEVVEKHRFDAQGISFDLRAGDALAFLVRVVHKSGPNQSTASRWSLAYNYVRRDTYDLGSQPHYVGYGTPITRQGEIYSWAR